MANIDTKSGKYYNNACIIPIVVALETRVLGTTIWIEISDALIVIAMDFACCIAID